MNTTGTIKKETVNCEKCAKPFDYFLGANAYTVICPHCSTIYDGYTGTLVSKKKAIKPPLKKPDISLGTKGTLNGIPYLVIGYVKKKEKGSNYFWQEYTLFNPIHGYASLSVFNGHWNYFTEFHFIPVESTYKKVLELDGQNYDIYARYYAVTVEAAGEFPYDLSSFEMPSVEEYINPPYILTSEKTKTDYIWFKGEYIAPSDIKKAFNLEEVPEQIDIGSTQPFFSKFRSNSLINFLIFIISLLVALQLFFHFMSKEEIAFHKEYVVSDSTVRKEIYTEPFDLKYGTKNLDVRVLTNVDNNWMYSGITLVNEKTGDVYDVDIDIEYYHGYEDGESWSEGTNWNSKVLSQIPEGRYYFIIYPDKHPGMRYGKLELTATRDVPVTSNMFVVLVLLLIFPIIYFYRKQAFENKRWSNSDYGGYE